MRSRYHQGLVGPLLGGVRDGARVLVLGGGDGLAARDLLVCSRIARILIVDWDRAVTCLFRSRPELTALNRHALDDRRVRVVHDDVRHVLAGKTDRFDLVIGDLTDARPGAPECRPGVRSDSLGN